MAQRVDASGVWAPVREPALDQKLQSGPIFVSVEDGVERVARDEPTLLQHRPGSKLHRRPVTEKLERVLMRLGHSGQTAPTFMDTHSAIAMGML